MTVASQKSLMLLSGRAYPELAEQIAAEIGVTVTSTTAREFANGETFIKPDESVRGSDAFVIQSFTTPINQWVMEALILTDALKRARRASPQPPPGTGAAAVGSRSQPG